MIQVGDTFPPVTVLFEHEDIHQVLMGFSDFAGISFVVGADVQGDVTGSFRDQPWDVALDALLRANGLIAVEAAPGIWRVACARSEAGMRTTSGGRHVGEPGLLSQAGQRCLMNVPSLSSA
jgi:type II secretory pathway component HofQ